MSGSNNLLTPQIIANESLLILSNNLVAASLVHRGDTQNFLGAKVGDTITIRRPASFTVNEFTSSISPQGIVEQSVPLVLEKHFDISVELTSKQLTLNLTDFGTQVVQPAMVAMAEQIDSYIYSKYTEINEITGDGNLNSVADLADVDRKLMVQKVPMAGRVGFLNPLTKARFLSIDNLVRQDTRGAAGLAGLTEASMGRAMGIDWYGAQAVASHVAGAPGGTPVGTAAAGATVVAVASGGNAGTYRAGDIITFANHSQTYTVVSNVTLNGTGAGNITISPALAVAVSSQAITLRAAHPANIVGHPRGISLASVPLELPMEPGGAATVTNQGISIRVVYKYDITSKKNIISFDCIMGAKVTDPRLLCRFDG